MVSKCASMWRKWMEFEMENDLPVKLASWRTKRSKSCEELEGMGEHAQLREHHQELPVKWPADVLDSKQSLWGWIRGQWVGTKYQRCRCSQRNRAPLDHSEKLILHPTWSKVLQARVCHDPIKSIFNGCSVENVFESDCKRIRQYT